MILSDLFAISGLVGPPGRVLRSMLGSLRPFAWQARIFLEQEEDEQLRDLVMSMVGNPLVILIKLADRLHNMRTVYALKPNKARAVAAETRQLWCSLAERLGILPLKVLPHETCKNWQCISEFSAAL